MVAEGARARIWQTASGQGGRRGDIALRPRRHTARLIVLLGLTFAAGWGAGWVHGSGQFARLPGIPSALPGQPGPGLVGPGIAGWGLVGSAPGQLPPAGPPTGPAAPGLPAPVSGSEAAVRSPRLPEVIDLSSMFPGLVYVSGPRDSKRVALTFDDGPDDRFTPRVLDILKQEGVPATFFMVGNRVRAFPETVARAVRDGHAVGNHTWDHARLAGIPGADVRRNIEAAQTAISEVTGYRPSLFRPTYGDLTPSEVSEIAPLGVKIIFWSVDTLDWHGLNSEQVVAAVMSHAHPGAIVLQHSAGGPGEDLSGSIGALPIIIRDLRAQGYQFVTVPELLSIPVAASDLHPE